MTTTTCIIYTRDEGGRITRMPPTHRPTMRLTAAELAEQYPHAERLRGWPETEVRWDRETGEATGVAPKHGPVVA